MSETPPEVSGNLADDLNTSLVTFTACIGEALEDICSYSLTIGETYVPFDPDEEDSEDNEACDDDGGCNQAWVRVSNIAITNVAENSFAGTDGCYAGMRLTLEVGILRCVAVPEKGEAPSATEVMACAFQSMEDMKRIYCAAMGCEDAGWAAIHAQVWTPNGPLGGQYGGIWTFDVETD